MRSRSIVACLPVVAFATAASAQAPRAAPRGAGERRVTAAPAAPASGRGERGTPARPPQGMAVSTGNAAPEGEASASRTPERRLPRIITAPPAAGRDHRPRRPFFFPGGSCAIPPCFCATWPAGAFFYPFGYASSYYDAPLRSAEDERPPSRPKIIEGAPEPAYGELRIEALGDSLLRLSRPSSTRPVQEVRFFVADAQQQVLAQQVITAAPFTAVFAATPVALFAGVETVFPDGARTAVILPLRPVPAR